MFSMITMAWSFFTGSSSGRSVGLGIIGVLAVMLLLGAYWLHISSVESNATAAATAQWQRQQLEQVVSDQRRTLEQLEQLRISQERLSEVVQTQRQALARSVLDLTQYLSSAEARAGDRAASAPLRETVNRLRNLTLQDTTPVTLPPTTTPVSRRRTTQ